jgi:hypothetical protein
MNKFIFVFLILTIVSFIKAGEVRCVMECLSWDEGSRILKFCNDNPELRKCIIDEIKNEERKECFKKCIGEKGVLENCILKVKEIRSKNHVSKGIQLMEKLLENEKVKKLENHYLPYFFIQLFNKKNNDKEICDLLL